MKQRLLALLTAAGLTLALAACTAPGAQDSAAPSPSPSQAASAAPSQAVAADLTQALLPFAAGMESEDTALTVNGQAVPADLFLYWLALNCTSFDQYAQFYGMTVDQYADQLLQDSITMTAYYVLMEQKALEEGCPLTDQQVAQIQQDMVANGQETYDNQKLLFDLTDETIEFIFSVTQYYDNLLAALTQDPTQEQLEQYISDNGIFSVKHILLQTTDEDVTDDQGNTTTAADYNAQQKALAEDLLAQLQASDDQQALFDTLMEEYSEDGRNSDGTLASPDGYVFDNTTQLVDGFREAALALEVGQLSDIVETDYGYHIMLRGAVDPESYRDACRQDELGELIDQWLEQSEVTPVEAVENLDVGDFYAKYTAWQEAMANQLQEDSSASPNPDPSPSPQG